ncbi:MAG: hypothetical protein HS132_02480 [Planctomycetia bacterium]|nr:hypothetical protein [Planctomycetia bacterium]
MPKEQRHRIKLLWPLEQGGMGTTLEKQRLYSRISYNGLYAEISALCFTIMIEITWTIFEAMVFPL